MRVSSWCAATIVLAVTMATASAAELPAHSPLKLLIVSDSANPHGLALQHLTQAGELGPALADPRSGLALDGMPREVHSQCIDEALALLSRPEEVDAFIYFAHLEARGCDGVSRQEELVDGVEDLLVYGGGVVLFHHGMYSAPGKEDMLQLLGSRASSIGWNDDGQDVIAVDSEHFVSTHGLRFTGERMFWGAGIAEGQYPYFNNTPDERYEITTLLEEPGEARTILFTSADTDGASSRVLGYSLWRPGWEGEVVAYQPGEYQPRIIDDPASNDFQILVNAIYHASIVSPSEDPSTGTSTGGSAETAGTSSTGGEGDETATVTGTTSHASTSRGVTSSSETGSGTDGEVPTDARNVGPDSSSTAGDLEGTRATSQAIPVGSCACRSQPSRASWAFGPLLLSWVRRRARSSDST